MKHLTSYSVAVLLLTSFALCAGCSTQKNTGASRAWHELKVIHNVQFNGEMAYNEGLEAINQAHSDNFSTFLPLYPVSDHQAAESAASSMDKAIDKCRKSIKLHSIKARPKINHKKHDNAKYQNWLKNKEFNNQMYRAWLMLGQSEFHKGDFLGAVGTFRYVERLYDNDPNMMALCQLWVARAYGEMGWQYEAEEVLSKVKIDDLKYKNRPYYSAVSADLQLKGEHYKEAIPFLKVAKQDEKRKKFLPRFEYVLAQLYQANGQDVEARSAYKRVYKLHPKDVNMEFNARIHYAELKGDTTKSMKQLRQMTRLYKYRDHLDQIYGIMGNIYLTNHDTIRALDYYHRGIKASTQNGNEKGEILIKAGDLYYDRYAYTNALPCYHEAAQILNANHPEYKRISHRSEILDEIVVEEETIQLQDSLQQLGYLSPEEQLAVAERIVAELIERERQDSLSQAEQAREAELEEQSGGLQSVNLNRMIGNRTGDDANWYFYNPQLMRNGQQEFTRKWGSRALQDDWWRMSRTTSAHIDNINDNAPMDDEQNPINDSTTTAQRDSVNTITTTPPSTDVYSPDFYLQQIPKTASDYAASDTLIANAMYRLVALYRDRLCNMALSERMLNTFITRFGNDARVLDLYYDAYLYALRTHNDTAAANYRLRILERYPESAQAKIVSDPHYFVALQKMANEQDSLYAATYASYKQNNFAQVKENKAYADASYPLSPLMPNMLFLNAIAVAKTDGQEPFKTALQEMVQRYPANELSAMAKDMLAMMGQGMESQQGGTTSTLTEQRQAEIQETENENNTEKTFSDERNEKSCVYMIINNDEQQLNNLLYEVALFNFSQFLIKDFDLRKIPVFTLSNSALEIGGFESIDEAEWYMSLLGGDSDLQTLLQQLQANILPITNTNAQLINHPFTIDDYIRFYHK